MSAIVVLFFLFAINSVRANTQPELILSFDFTDGSLTDSVSSNILTNRGAQPAPDRCGRSRSAFFFDGENADLHVARSAHPLYPHNTYSYVLWMCPKGPHVGDLFTAGVQSTRAEADFELVTSGELNFHHGSDGVKTQSIVGTGVWTQVAITRQEGSIRIYVNGKLVREGNLIGTRIENSSLTIGSDHGKVEFFHGEIDDFRIYIGSLTSEEIATMYAEELCQEDQGESNKTIVIVVPGALLALCIAGGVFWWYRKKAVTRSAKTRV